MSLKNSTTYKAQASSTPDLHSTELWEAIRTKDLTNSWRILLAGTNPNVRDSSTGFTPLHAVCLDGNVALAMLLFTKGADVNAKDSSGQTPLHKACVCGHLQIVTFLIKANANAEILDNMNRSAEELAFQHGHLPIFRLLVGIKGGGEKRVSVISAVSHDSAKAMKKEQEKRERERKKLEYKEKKLIEEESELQEKINGLTDEKERLEAITEVQRTKKEKQALVQITAKLQKLQLKCDENTDKIKVVRSSTFENHPSDKGQAWIDFVKEES